MIIWIRQLNFKKCRKPECKKDIQDKSETERVLRLVGLDKTNAKLGSFSMSMKQRLGIMDQGRILAENGILVLQESTGYKSRV